ncbi:MAG: hypothetical protein KA052_02400 [Candidatus Pacebacteria bacterium]|nr:hypothetical protein [Candidatus Paceibacterota bacterium]
MENDPIRPVEIKDLNKTQLILLAILLSFITSIATGIVTVTLMQQAPTAIIQPINRVVQQTIEKVVPNYIPGKTQTVVVREDDIVVTIVEKTQAAYLPLLQKKDSEAPTTYVFSVGKGVFIGDSAPLDPASTYIVKEGELFLDVKVSGVSPLGFALLKATASDAPTKNLPTALFARNSDIKVGETALTITKETVQKGFVQSIQKGSTTVLYDMLKLSTMPSADMIGGMVVDLDGNIIGLVVPKIDGGAVIIGVDAVTKFIANPVTPKEGAETEKTDLKPVTP